MWRRWLTILVLTATVMLGCTSRQKIAVDTLSEESVIANESIEVVTKDGTRHGVKSWTVTDTTLIVEKAFVPGADMRDPNPEVPYSIDLASIDYVEKHELAHGKSFVILTSMFVVGMVIWAFATLSMPSS